MMTIYSAGGAVSDTFADRDDARVPADQVDLIVVLLFVVIGLLLTGVFVTLGFGAEIGQILAGLG